MQVSPRTVEPSSQYWQWRHQSIHYVQAGHHPHRPPLLLIHGFGASTDHWRKTIAGLSAEFEVWAVDLLGFGRSTKPEWDYGGELWRSQLYDFITEKMGRAAVLVGNSLGGYTSLCVAAEHPDAVRGVVLLNSAGPFSDSLQATKPDPIREVMGNVVRNLFQQDWASSLVFQYMRQKSVIRKTLEKVYLDPNTITDQLVEDIYRPSCDPGAAKVFASVFRNPKGEPVDRLLQQMDIPLLALWGEADPWINAKERGAKFRQHYPNLTEYYLRAGHCPHDEVPTQVNALLRSWMMSLDRS